MSCIRSMPEVRKGDRGVIQPADLEALIRVLQAYIDSAKKSTPPSKNLVHSVAHALMQEGAVLSKKWDKTQLALIIQK